jgi:glutamine synthetase
MVAQLSVEAGELGIKYFLVTYTDLAGAQRAKLVTAPAIDKVVEHGVEFTGDAPGLGMAPSDPVVFARPDANSLVQLPWKPEVAWLAADPWMAGAPLARAPRVILGALAARAGDRRLRMKSAVATDFFLVSPDGAQVADPRDRQGRPDHDQSALMRRYDVLTEVCDAMLSLGWDPDQIEHGDANGKFGTAWLWDDAIATADRHTFFKYMVKAIAERHGLRATFMPKPFADAAGGACHARFALYRGELNQFLNPGGPLGLSDLAHAFLGGVTRSAEALTALLNPTVNSYKRINDDPDGRTRSISVPAPGWIELRMADSAVNPYLLQAGVLCAGLDGMANPGETPAGSSLGLAPAPLNLLDAVRAFERSEALTTGLGDLAPAYGALKTQEWRDHAAQLSPWEREATLDC